MPEVFRLISLVLVSLSDRSYESSSSSYIVALICALVSFRIIVIGLSKVQRLSYGLAILNLLLPQLAVVIFLYSIRSMVSVGN